MVTKLDGEKKKRFLEVYALSEDERASRDLTGVGTICKYIGVASMTYARWKEAEDKKCEDGKSAFERNATTIDDALMAACRKGNSQALRIYYQLTNQLVERKEEKITIELSADIIATAFYEAKEYIIANRHPIIGQGQSKGVDEVLPQPDLLS